MATKGKKKKAIKAKHSNYINIQLVHSTRHSCLSREDLPTVPGWLWIVQR